MTEESPPPIMDVATRHYIDVRKSFGPATAGRSTQKEINDHAAKYPADDVKAARSRINAEVARELAIEAFDETRVPNIVPESALTDGTEVVKALCEKVRRLVTRDEGSVPEHREELSTSAKELALYALHAVLYADSLTMAHALVNELARNRMLLPMRAQARVLPFRPMEVAVRPDAAIEVLAKAHELYIENSMDRWGLRSWAISAIAYAPTLPVAQAIAAIALDF